jgi:hypothetical protein
MSAGSPASVVAPSIIETAIGAVADPIERFIAFVTEREAVRRRRADGKPWPWTQDAVLQQWRFCNIQRVHDRTTQEIVKMWREPHSGDDDLWFAMAVARLVNHAPALEELGYPIAWDADHFIAVMEDRKRRGEPCEGRAYVIHADNHASARGELKATYIARRVLTPLWNARANLRPHRGDSLAAVHERLTDHEGIGGFIGAQFIADVKYVLPLRAARDWWTFAASGPGTRRGLNLVLGRDLDTKWEEHDWHKELMWLASEIAPYLRRADIGRLHAQDLQNSLCEYRRYEMLRLDL